MRAAPSPYFAHRSNGKFSRAMVILVCRSFLHVLNRSSCFLLHVNIIRTLFKMVGVIARARISLHVRADRSVLYASGFDDYIYEDRRWSELADWWIPRWTLRCVARKRDNMSGKRTLRSVCTSAQSVPSHLCPHATSMGYRQHWWKETHKLIFIYIILRT